MVMSQVASTTLKVKGPGIPWGIRQSIKDHLIGPLSLLCGAAIWETTGWVLGLSWLPPLSKVVAALIELIRSGVIIGNLFASLQALVIGFTVSLVVGLLVGMLMARYRSVEEALDVYVNAMLFAPSIIFAPLFFALWGLSDITRIAVIVKYSMFVIIINTFIGIRTVDPALIEMGRSFGASGYQLFSRILLPASLPVIFAGFRLGMGRGVFGMINGEMFIAYVGLGALAAKYGGQFDATKVFAVTLVVLVVAWTAGSFVKALDRKLTRWAE